MNKGNYGKGFYIVLTFCIVAIGVAGYANFNDQSEPTAVISDNIVVKSNQTIESDTTPVTEQPVVEQEITEQQVIAPEIIETTPVIDDEPEPSVAIVEPIEEPQATVTISPTVEITKTEQIFVRPSDGGVITENSLDELVKNVSMNDWRTHNATDYYVTEGQNIFAITDGEIISIETNDQYGTIIEISHTDGLVTKTCGLNSDTVVSIGDHVVAGDVIGTAMGTFPAEAHEGTHIHVEATINGENIDIETLFK